METAFCDNSNEKSSEYDNVDVRALNPDKYFLSRPKILM